MARRGSRSLALSVAAVVLAALPASASGPPGASLRREEPRSAAPAPRASVPIPFEPNAGQADPAVRFLARGRGFTLLLTDGGAVIACREGGVLRMRLAGPEAPAALAGEGRLPGRSHYFLGNDPARWRRGIPHFRGVLARGAGGGADLRWHGTGGALEYQILCPPGADRGRLALEFEGAREIRVDPAGDLLLRVEGGVLRQSRPVAYQPAPGGRRAVAARFVPAGSGRVGVEVGPLDPALPLVVDPRLEYSSYLGGYNVDQATAVAVGPDDSLYVASTTYSVNFVLKDPLQGSLGGSTDLAVTKFDGTTRAVVYSTYLGGNSSDQATAIRVDSDGAVYLAGTVLSTNFPTQSAYQYNHGGGNYDGVLAKLIPSGASLAFSTYLGGNSDDYCNGLDVNGAGEAAVTGTTASLNFPLQSALDGTKAGDLDAFVTKFASSGSSVAFSTYLGGTGTSDFGRAIAYDGDGKILVGGYTDSTDFPVQSALQGAYGGGGSDGFITRIEADGTAIAWSTYFGGGGQEQVRAVAVDGNGTIVLGGITDSANFPKASPVQGTIGGFLDGFVSRLSSDGSSLLFSTFLGGTNADSVDAVAVNGSGGICAAGLTYGSGFPVVNAVQGTLSTGPDAFVVRIAGTPPAFVYSTFLGGSGYDQALGIAQVGTGPVVVGSTNSADFPTASPLEGVYDGGVDGFVSWVTTTPLPPSNLSSLLVAVDSIQLNWTRNGSDEQGFEIERRTAGNPFAVVATVGAGVTQYTDAGLQRGTIFWYRVRAYNADGTSGPSNEVTRKTPPLVPVPPTAPTGMQATAVSSTRVDLSWTDTSLEENFFNLARSVEGGLFQTIATPKSDVTAYTDTGVLPDRDYAYFVRAGNIVGSSDPSNTDAVSTPPTLAVSLAKGRLKDSASLGRDTLLLEGTLGPEDPEAGAAPDPVEEGMEVWFGGWAGQRLLALGPAEPGWKERRGKWTWKSPKGSLTKVLLKFDPASGKWRLQMSRLTFAAPVQDPLRISVQSAADAGSQEGPWTETRPGKFRYP